MITKRIPILITTLAVFLAIAPRVQAQATILSIDFESPTYNSGMANGGTQAYPAYSAGDYPSPWISVGENTTIITSGAIAGSQSMKGSNDFSDFWVQTAGQYDIVTITMVIQPNHTWTGSNNFVTGGAIAFYADGTADPNDAGLVLQGSVKFSADGTGPHVLHIKGDAGTSGSTDTGVEWTTATNYTVAFSMNLVDETTSLSVSSGVTVLWSDTGVYTATSLDDFRIHLSSGSNTAGDFTLYDSITVTGSSAVPEPSTYAAVAGLAALGLAMWRRRRSAQ